MRDKSLEGPGIEESSCLPVLASRQRITLHHKAYKVDNPIARQPVWKRCEWCSRTGTCVDRAMSETEGTPTDV